MSRIESPAGIDAFLREHFSLDSVMRYQQEVGKAACVEVAKELRYKADSMSNQDDFHEGFTAAVDYIDPVLGYLENPVPSGLFTFGA